VDPSLQPRLAEGETGPGGTLAIMMTATFLLKKEIKSCNIIFSLPGW